MKVYAITINPQSPFGTPFKGDTIFGHFCWQAAHNPELLSGGLDHWIDRYPEKPFAVFTSAWPQIVEPDGQTFYCLPKPAMPAAFPTGMVRKQRLEQRKKEKNKKWILLEQDSLRQGFVSFDVVNDKELFAAHQATLSTNEKRMLQFLPAEQQKPVITSTHAHNSINRLTMTTGKGFDPFSMENFHYLPGLKLVLFVAFDEDALDQKKLCKGLENIGRFGFGRDASSGLGRFDVGEFNELEWPLPVPGQGCYTLAPCVPDAERFSEQFALPFTRFGRHGDRLGLSKNPFKNPVVMADEGAVFFPADNQLPTVPYIGRAVTGLSQVEERTVAQGYSPYLPMSRRSS